MGHLLDPLFKKNSCHPGLGLSGKKLASPCIEVSWWISPPSGARKKEPAYLRHGDQGTLDGDVAGSVAPTCSWKMWCPMAKGMTPTWALDLDWVNMTQQKLKWQNYRLKIELIRSTLITKPENPNSSGKVNQRSRWSPEVFFWVWCPHQFSRGGRNSTLSNMDQAGSGISPRGLGPILVILLGRSKSHQNLAFLASRLGIFGILDYE